jgi:hypothetical protein
MTEGIDLEAAWAAVESDWDDPGRHAAFVSQCQIAGKLGFAATKYRGVSGQNEAYRSLASRSEDAKKRLDAITTLAIVTLQSTATRPEETDKTMRWLKAAAVLVLVFALLVLQRGCSA